MAVTDSKFEASLRERRQITIPSEICESLGIVLGDQLELELTEDGVLLRPKKVLALNALREIRRAFAASSITEDELQAEGRTVREQLARSRYGEG